MPKKTYTQINSVNLATAASSASFSSLPQNFRDLVLVVSGAITGSQGNNFLYFNNDTTQANYHYVRILGDGSSPSAANDANATVSDMVSSQNNVIVHIFDYSASDKQKSRLSRSNQPSSTVIAYASRWNNSSPVTTVTFAGGNGGNLAAGTTVTLYGIEA